MNGFWLPNANVHIVYRVLLALVIIISIPAHAQEAELFYSINYL